MDLERCGNLLVTLTGNKEEKHMATLTAGIIGFGERGKTLVKVIQNHVPDIRLVSACDPAEGARKEASDLGLAAYATAEEFFEKSHPDIAVITTNPPDHSEGVLMAAERGSHIFCEKPLALSPEEADRMVKAVRKAGVVCTVDFETIFSDSFSVLKDELGQDGFGRLIRIDAVDKGRPPAYDIETCMPHFLHAFMVLTGSKPIEVFGRVIVDGRRATLADVVSINSISTQYPKRAHDIGMRSDSIEASYLFGNGVTARYFLAALDEKYVINAGKHAKPGSEFMNFVCHGTRGQVKWHQTAMGYVYRKAVPEDTLSVANWELVFAPTKPDPTWEVPTARLVWDFVDAIKQDREPLTSIEDARTVVDQTYGIYASHLADCPVKLPLKDRKHPLRAGRN